MKSRILWLSYGDANTKFFHVQTKIKRAWQHIIALKNEADVFWVQRTTLHTLILNTFKSIFQSFSSLQLYTPQTFYSPPGPDGFHAQFFQSNWNSLGNDVAKSKQTIFITTRIPEDLTRIKLALIPKISNLETVTHLQPVSLCNTLYKLLTKLLINRLKPFLPAMIHSS